MQHAHKTAYILVNRLLRILQKRIKKTHILSDPISSLRLVYFKLRGHLTATYFE